MDSTEPDDKVIELDDSEDEDDDIDLTMDSVPFREKVEKWLMSTCNEAKKVVEDPETIFQQKTVQVSEVIDETESLHSVDTEQYIKSNRRKTTTKITTTTIKKYYFYNGAKNTLNTIGNKDSCNANRKKGPRRPSNNLATSTKGTELKTSPKKRHHQSRQDCDANHLNVDNDSTHLDQAPFADRKNDGKKIALNCRPPYNTRNRLNNEVQNKNLICAGTAKAFNGKKKTKRAKVTKKRDQLSMKRCQVRLKPSYDFTDSVGDLSSPKATKKSSVNSKLKTGSLNYSRAHSDSEQDDILLTSYKPFSLFK